MLRSVLMKSKSAYLPLSKEAENDEQIDVSIPLNDHRNTWHLYLWSAAIGLIAAIIGGALTISLNLKINNTGDNKLEQLLHPPVETVVFHRNQTFIDPPPGKSDQAWESLIPGFGNAHRYIAIEHAEQYELPPGKQRGLYTQNFGVSMYHQLQCLISIRDLFWGLLTKKYNASDYHFQDPSGLDTALTMRVDLHINCCFGYLRQGIMCAGDMTLEGVANGEAVTGWGMTHRECRSWDAAKKFMEEHQPPEDYIEERETTGESVE